jgi:hypothetical protein
MLLYFDTNVYHYLAQVGQARDLRDLLRVKHHAVSISRDNVMESARIKDPDRLATRFKTIKTVASSFPKFPESYVESRELLQEFRRKRPSWLLTDPDLKEVKYFLRNYRLLMTTTLKQGALGLNESFQEYVCQVERAIDVSKPYDKTVHEAVLNASNVEFGAANPKWHHLIEHLSNTERYWRIRSTTIWHQALTGDPSMRDYNDWVSPYVDIRKIDTSDWNMFWLRDVVAAAVPTSWVRCLTEYHQMAVSVSHGNKIDVNHALRLIDCDAFFTCDQQFYRVIRTVASEVGVKVAIPFLIDASQDNAVEQFKSILNYLPSIAMGKS